MRVTHRNMGDLNAAASPKNSSQSNTGSMSQKVHPRHSAQLVVSSTGESLFLAGLNPSAIIWDHITLGKSLVSLVLQTATALVAALAYWVFWSLLFTISFPICMLLLPFLVILHCWALLSQCLIRVRRAGLALGSQHLLPPGVLCSSLEAPWQPWKDIRRLMNYKMFPIFQCQEVYKKLVKLSTAIPSALRAL